MKYSRQREMIHHAVVKNPIHPTADTVYAIVRAQEPNISLGTVYRNLNLLAAQGILRKIDIPNASDRFDARLDPHHHILCEKCGRLFDIELGDLSALEEQILQTTEFEVTKYQILLSGFCPDCKVQH